MGIRILFAVLCFSVLAGCSSTFGVPQSSGSGFLRKEFMNYKSVAVLPFEGDDSGEVLGAFTRSFQEKFPRLSIVDRKKVMEALRDHPLRFGQVDEPARAKAGKTLGAQAFITGQVLYPSITRWLLQVIVVDAETGKVMGRSVAEIDYVGALRKEEGARLAVEKLTIQ